MERLAAGECRAEGRTIIGVAMPYGERSPGHRERFLPGAFDLAGGRTRWLNLRHDPYTVLAHSDGGGLAITDTPGALQIRADLPAIPAADLALDGLRSGELGGLSVEFRALSERRENDTRIIERADLYGIGVVARPSYSGATVEVRQRSGRTIRQFIPANTSLGCRCAGDGCRTASISGDAIEEAFQTAWNESVEVLAVKGGYGNPLASKSAGSVRASVGARGATVEVDLPNGPDGEAVLRDIENTGAVLVRPHFDADRSEGVREGETMRYERAVVRSLVVGATDAREGWPAPELVQTPDELLERSALREDRRIAAWL